MASFLKMKNKKAIDQTINNFLSFLDSKGVSPQTLKFYKSDLSHFTGWLILKIRALGVMVEEFSQSLPFLKTSFSHEYKKYLLENKIPQKTINRRLSTLRGLAKFLVATQILDFDFCQNLNNVSVFSPRTPKLKTLPLIEGFRKYLEAQKVSGNTRKNYLADIRQFLVWIEKHSYAV